MDSKPPQGRSVREDTSDTEEESDSESIIQSQNQSKQDGKQLSRPRRHAGSQRKIRRITGSKPAKRKRVTVEGDSDDELIWSMKTAGHSDLSIRDRLLSEGRIQYNVKTISTRFRRMKAVRATANEKILEADESQEDDDRVLRKAIAQTQAKNYEELGGIGKRRWDQVADLMNSALPQPKKAERLPKEDKEQPQRCICQNPTKTQAAAVRKREQARANREAGKKPRQIQQLEKKDLQIQARQMEYDRIIAGKLDQAMKRERRQQEKTDQSAHRAWTKRLKSQEQHQKLQETKIRRSQEALERKAALLRIQIDEENRKALIRRYMKAAGAQIAAPTE